MEIKFREKKKYCKVADMYLFDKRDTKERKLKVRKIIKIFLVIEVAISLIASQRGTLLFGHRSYIETSLSGLIVKVLIFTIGIIIGFFILDKMGFDWSEKRGRRLLHKIGGVNYEKFVDTDVNIVLSDEKIIWTRASKQLNIGYEEIKK